MHTLYIPEDARKELATAVVEEVKAWKLPPGREFQVLQAVKAAVDSRLNELSSEMTSGF